MNRTLTTLAICFVLGLSAWVQASSRQPKQDKDRDQDNRAAHAQNVKLIHGPVVESAKRTTATIAWSTNVSSSSILKYGTNPNQLNRTAEVPWGGVTHRVHLRNLKPGTTYYYRVESTQAKGSGSHLMSGVQQFRTQGAAAAAASTASKPAKPAAVKLTHGPVVESAKATTASIAWSTNAKASTILKYGTNPNQLNQTAEAPWGGVTHRVHLRNLKPGTTYYYRVESTQALGTGTQTLSGVEHFRTQGGPATAAANMRGRQLALHNFHQFLVSHPNIKADLQKNPNLARNGRYQVQHPGFGQFLQTHPGVRQYLAQNPSSFMQSEAVMR